MTSFRAITLKLSAVGAGAQAADQIILAAIPLTAVTAFHGNAADVGLLLAAHSAAWLIVSLPAGVLVDRLSRQPIQMWSQLLAAAAVLAAMAALWMAAPTLLGTAVFTASAGVVFYMLAATSLIPRLVKRQHLSTANARVEFARAAVSVAAPVIVGQIFAAEQPLAAYGLAAGAALLAAAVAARLPRDPTPVVERRHPLTDIAAGARFVWRNGTLRAISFCAVAWNFAFFALLAAFVPFALSQVTEDIGVIGMTQSGHGIGLLLGALAAPKVLRLCGPGFMLLFGPAASAFAPVLFLWAAEGSGPVLLFAGYVLLGFGPMMWLICQTSIRQIVTRPDMLGRVGATIQVAIYGVRPLGALVGGWTTTQYGPEEALWLVSICFACSLLAMAIPRAGRLRSLDQLSASDV